MTQLNKGLTNGQKIIPTHNALAEYSILVQISPNREGCNLFFNSTKVKGLNLLRKKPEELITKGTTGSSSLELRRYRLNN